MPLVTDDMLLREARIKDAAKLTRRLSGMGFRTTEDGVWMRDFSVDRVQQDTLEGWWLGNTKVVRNSDTEDAYTIYHMHSLYLRYIHETQAVVAHENVRLADVASTIQKDWDAHKVTGRRNVWWSHPS